MGRQEERTSVWIIEIQNVPLRFEVPEQPCLRVEVGRFGTVIIKMIATQVGKCGHRKRAAADAFLCQSMAGNFHHRITGTRSNHLRQQVVQQCGIGGGLWRRQALGPDAVIHRAQHADGFPGGLQDGFDDVSRGGLAVCSGNADQGQLARRVPIIGAGQHGHRLVAIRYANDRLALRLHPGPQRGGQFLNDKRAGAPVERFGEKAVPVRPRPSQGGKQGVPLHVARVRREVLDRAMHAARQDLPRKLGYQGCQITTRFQNRVAPRERLMPLCACAPNFLLLCQTQFLCAVDDVSLFNRRTGPARRNLQMVQRLLRNAAEHGGRCEPPHRFFFGSSNMTSITNRGASAGA